MLLDGKEIQGLLPNDLGAYSVDLDNKGMVVAEVQVKVSLIEQLKKLAAKTNTPVDDAAIAWVEKMLALL